MNGVAPAAVPARSSLKQRVLRAGGWAFGGHVAAQAIRLGGNLLLTRLLVPEAFGLMAIVYVVMIGFALFSDLGIGQNIVQNARGDDPAFLDTAWTLQAMRGFVIFGLAALASAALPLAASRGWLQAGTVYADPMLPWVVTVFALSAIVSGFESTKLATARRHMQVKPVTQIELASQLLSLVLMAGLAWKTHSIWALVAGGLMAAVVRTALSHWVLPGHANRFAWNKDALQELLSFGKWVFVSSIVGFLVINGDRLLLGGMVPAETLGMYAIAFLLVNALFMIVSTMTGSVVFPALSQIVRERPQDLRSNVNKFQLATDFFLLGCAGFLMMCGSSIVTMLYDPRYQEAGPMLCVLAIGAIGVRYQVVETCFLAMGKPSLLTYSHALRWLVLYIGVPVAFHAYGFEGALFAIVASQFASWPVSLYFKWRLQLSDWRVELLGVVPFLIGMLAGRGFQAIAPTRAAIRSMFLS